MLSNSLLALVIGPVQTQHWVAPLLMAAGFIVIEAMDSIQGMRLAVDRHPDIAIADEAIMGSGSTNPLLTLKRITDAPILVIGNGSGEAVLMAIQQGADSYVDPSTGPRELLARIQSLLRRHLLVKVANRLRG
jgi:DNA-binding response OmpR family regulator